jgi:hypothetical protein
MPGSSTILLAKNCRSDALPEVSGAQSIQRAVTQYPLIRNIIEGRGVTGAVVF